MKKALIVAAAAFSVAACSQNLPTAPGNPPAPAASSSVTGGAGPVVTGSAHTVSAGGDPRVVAFNAVGLPDGSASGEAQINVRSIDAWWHTRIECLAVVGNRAFLGGTITAVSDARIRVGTKSYFWVEDHGEGAGAPPDRVSLAGVNETPEGLADFCGLIQNLLPGLDVLRGNVQIR
jgi:hypothetical protein